MMEAYTIPFYVVPVVSDRELYLSVVVSEEEAYQWTWRVEADGVGRFFDSSSSLYCILQCVSSQSSDFSNHISMSSI